VYRKRLFRPTFRRVEDINVGFITNCKTETALTALVLLTQFMTAIARLA